MCLMYKVSSSITASCVRECPWFVQVTSVKVDPIIRGGIRRFTDMIGQLWCSLSDYYIRAGHFEKVNGILDLCFFSSPLIVLVRFHNNNTYKDN